eukprot:COSAG05_NODE_225_length_13597_cov_18.878723_6_plen_61_part_00
MAISSISVLAYVTMNEVARQLEDPFGHEVNQLPIEELHMDFNERCVFCFLFSVSGTFDIT